MFCKTSPVPFPVPAKKEHKQTKDKINMGVAIPRVKILYIVSARRQTD